MNPPGNADNAEDNVSKQRPVLRLPLLALPFVFALLLLMAALVVLASSPKAKPGASEPQPAATATIAVALTSPTTPPQAQPTSPPPQTHPALANEPTPAQPPVQTADVVAQVNGRDISRQVLQVMLAADRAMADLLDQPPPPGDNPLERLVNCELVRQAATAAGYHLEENYVVQHLQDFLEARGKSMQDLQSSLTAHDLSLDDFTAYFGQLLLVDGFSRTQAQAQGITVSEYLRQLQRDAHISFGPAAEEALAQAQSNSPQQTAAPAPTATPPEIARGTSIGQLVPLFELPVLNHPTADSLTAEDLIGKPTLLSFWTTWCGYCRRQTPVLVDAYARYGESVQFVGINVREERKQVIDYVKSNHIAYVIALDFDGQVANRYGVSGFPTTYFVDAVGRIVARYVGSLSPEQVESYLQQLLAGASP
jgi:cytochrome c biogenesis protein CcmG/thiol:disulfide interchange protein DsbE